MTTCLPDDAIARACDVSAAQHDRLCPRQVLGVRMGLAAGPAVGLDVPRADKRLLVFAETDGCVIDGVSAATNCTVGHRTLRVMDYGRVAITAVNTVTEQAVRISPRRGVREAATRYALRDAPRYYAQLESYQRMPERELLRVEAVELRLDLPALLGKPGVRVDCASCGEEVLNAREVNVDGRTLCLACHRGAYYTAARTALPAAT